MPEKKHGDCYAVVRDRSGLEELFDFGIEYVATFTGDREMIFVWDKMGTPRKIAVERVVLSKDIKRLPLVTANRIAVALTELMAERDSISINVIQEQEPEVKLRVRDFKAGVTEYDETEGSICASDSRQVVSSGAVWNVNTDERSISTCIRSGAGLICRFMWVVTTSDRPTRDAFLKAEEEVYAAYEEGKHLLKRKKKVA